MNCSRRTLLDLTIRAASIPSCAAFLASWMEAGQHAHETEARAPAQPVFLRDYRPRFFDARDFEALIAFTEILIPTDETPGAREAHCALFIDFLLDASAGYAPETAKSWRNAMNALRNTGFHDSSASKRAALVEQISAPERDRAARHPAFAAYQLLKRETAFAFYTSRAGIIECLDYRGNSYNLTFPACHHPEHHAV